MVSLTNAGTYFDAILLNRLAGKRFIIYIRSFIFDILAVGVTSKMADLLVPDFREWIEIPFKTTSHSSWNIAILDGLSGSWSQELVSVSGEKLHKLRESVRGIRGHDTGVDLLVEYYTQIDSLSKRLDFPLTVEFTWSESFDSSATATQSSIAFEKANILFNLATIYNNLGKRDRKSRDLLLSASLFRYVADNFLNPPLHDISRPTLLFFEELILAQVEEDALIKSLELKQSLSLAAKICSSIHERYSKICTKLRQNDLSALKVFLMHGAEQDHDILSLLHTKENLWSIYRHYVLAEMFVTNQKFGNAICLLKNATEVAVRSIDECRYDQSSSTFHFLKALSSKASDRLESISKENYLIYNQPVPSLSDIHMPGPTAVAQVLDFTQIKKEWPVFKDLFDFVIPTKGKIHLEKMREQRLQLLRFEVKKVQDVDERTVAVISSLAMEKSLKEWRAQLLPDFYSLAQNLHSRIILAQPAASLISTKMELKRITECLERIKATLSNEIMKGSGRPESSSDIRRKLSTDFFDTIADFESQIKVLSVKTGNIKCPGKETIIESSETVYRYLIQSRPLPESLSTQIEEIETNVRRLHNMTNQRACLLQTLGEQITKANQDVAIDISQLTIINNEVDELSKFDEVCSAIDHNIQDTNNLLERVASEHSSISNALSLSDVAVRQRELEDIISRFNSDAVICMNSLEKIQTDIKSLKSSVDLLFEKVEEFCAKQAEARTNHLRLEEIESASQGQSFLLERLNRLNIKSQRPDSQETSVNAKDNNRSLLD